MFNLIPLPYRWLIGAVLFAVWSGFMVYGGWHECSIREQAKQRSQALAYAEAVKQEQARGDKASLDLATAQTTIDQLNIERMRHVNQVTTGRECLSSAATSLLNSNASVQVPAGKPDAESTPAPATDTDVEAWAIESQGLYDTCAARLNGLIDYLQ